MSERLWKLMRELLHGSDLKAAARVENQVLVEAEEKSVHPDFQRKQRELQGAPGRAVRLGQIAEGSWSGTDLHVDVRDLLTHLHALGQSGSGKSYFILLMLRALLERRALSSLFVLDMKGELAELLTDLVLPGLAAALPPHEADAFLKRIVVIDPFSATHPPPLNVLVPDPGLPIAIQARDVAECFEAAAETDVTLRMETIHDWLLRLVIETNRRVTRGKGSFLTVRRALQEPAVLEGLVRETRDADITRYFLTRFPAEPKASRLALLARLDRFLALPMTQLSVGAKVCLDFDRLLEDRIVILSLGRAPAGLQSVARFFAMVILTRFVRAIFRRPPRSHGFASLLVADEWQIALNPALAAEFESILTLARSRGVHLWLANQQLSQLDRHGAGLRSVVLGQTSLQVAFRLAPEDPRALRHLFPTTGTMRRQAVPGSTSGTPFLSPSEELEVRLAGAARLPNRVGYWSDRRKPWGSVLMRSGTLDLPHPGSLPTQFVTQAQRGMVALTVADLEHMLDEEEKRLDQLAAGPARQPVRPPAAPPAPAAAAPAPPPPPPPPRPPRAPVVVAPKRPKKPKGPAKGPPPIR